MKEYNIRQVILESEPIEYDSWQEILESDPIENFNIIMKKFTDMTPENALFFFSCISR